MTRRKTSSILRPWMVETGLVGVQMFFGPVVGGQDDAPDVDRLVELDAVVRRIIGIDVDDASAAFLAGQVDMDHDLHAGLERVRARDEGTVQVDDDGFARAG